MSNLQKREHLNPCNESAKKPPCQEEDELLCGKDDDGDAITTNNTNAGRLAPVLLSRVPFGEFDGNMIYRNRIVVEEEHRKDGHYSINELVLPDCTSALCTAFHSSGAKWLNSIFGTIRQLMVVIPSSKESSHVIGKALVQPIEGTEKWYWVKARPHTGGCFHSKVLLFRSHRGLRVVISGNNLTKRQWECHRDVFWVQDFPLRKDAESLPGCFGYKLRQLLRDMTKCAKKRHQTVVTDHIITLFDKIDFVGARAELVFSFPRPKGSTADCGGWKQLSHAVYQAMHSRGMAVDPDDSSDDEGPTTLQTTSRLFATSGSFGNLEPDLLLQMYNAMVGRQPVKTASTTRWDNVDGLVKCFWPSVTTASTMELEGLCGVMRHMPPRHLKTIPTKSRQRVFHDAIPNPPTKFPSPFDKDQSFHAVTHGKFLYSDCGVLYVGSHNFSRGAWGLRDAQPKNVEVGVVLASINERTRAEWIRRLPCKLVAPNAISPPTYSPYAGWKTIQDHHPMANAWTNMWKEFHAMRAAKKLYKQAEGVLLGEDAWLIQKPLEGQTLEELEALLNEYGPIIESCIEEALEDTDAAPEPPTKRQKTEQEVVDLLDTDDSSDTDQEDSESKTKDKSESRKRAIPIPSFSL